ncbi:hypothetical protein QQF64_024843 [Cirrhinus molitorella]|uniref:Bcl-2 Bcl-2 homology region 1-3 domain-containing protein n=1 Tax=Cirrhinus molitorella TaxID=172907 RepID=A0ABR3NNN9_9TELE
MTIVGPRTDGRQAKRKAHMESVEELFKNLILRSVKDQLQSEGICLPSLPEPQPMSAEQEQLLEQMADVIKIRNDSLDQDPQFNEMTNLFAHLADRQNFQIILDNLLGDDISWGRIFSLICVVGRIAKIHPNSFPSIMSWTQDYFRDNVLSWICCRGGWLNSITFLVHYIITRNAGSSSSLISLPCGVFFISGVLLGGLICWRLNRGG